MTSPTQDEIELVRRLCNDLTRDVKNLANKDWLKVALVSHVAQLSKLDEDTVKPIVEVWFPKV